MNLNTPRAPLRTMILLLVALLSVVTARASELVINIKAKGAAAAIGLKINGDIATASVAGAQEKFNLKDMSWLDDTKNRWITLAQCQQWAEKSKAKTAESIDYGPANLRSFVAWSIDPTFKTEKSGDTLKLTSGQIDYVIEGEASKTDVDQYYRYAVLNAYKKAMTEKRAAPFAELKAIEEMKKLGCIPSRITVTVPGVPGATAIHLDIRETGQ